MPIALPMAPSGWIEIAGALLVATGLAMAWRTLLESGTPQWRPAWVPGLRSAGPMQATARRLDATEQLQRLSDIAGERLGCVDIVADLHARATEAVAAADDLASELMAHYRGAALPADTSRRSADRTERRERKQAPERIAA